MIIVLCMLQSLSKRKTVPGAPITAVFSTALLGNRFNNGVLGKPLPSSVKLSDEAK